MKTFLFSLFLLFIAALAFCDPGDVTVINTLSPKNNAFQFISRSTNVFVSTGAFSNNLGPADFNLQHAMNTIDQLVISGSGGGTTNPLRVSIGSVQVSSPTNTISFNSSQFTGNLSGGTTANISLNPSSVTIQGTFYPGTNITFATSAGSTTINAIATGTSIGQYVSSVTANSPLRASTVGTLGSTVTISIGNDLPGGSTSYIGSTALYISSITTDASLTSSFSGTSGATVTVKVNVSSISLPNSGVVAGSYTNSNITIDSHGLISSASNGSSGTTVISTMTAGATNFIFNQTFRQPGSAFVVDTGTINGIFTVQQPDNDTSDPAINLKTLTTQESASNMLHSLFLNGRIPNSASNEGEFIITDSSNDLTTNVGAFADRQNRSEIAFEPAGNPGGAQGIALRAIAHQLPNGNPIGDFYVQPGTVTSQNPLRLAYSGIGIAPVQADVNGILRTSQISLSSAVTGILPLNNMVSSVTVAGILTAGTNITITPGTGITTIAATGGGSSTSPGLPDTSIQMNQGGVFVGTTSLIYNTTTNLLTIGATTQFSSVSTTTWTSIATVNFGTGTAVNFNGSATISSGSTLTVSGEVLDGALSAGTSGQSYTSQGIGQAPKWTTISSGNSGFYWEPSIISGKILSPGTTNYPRLDNSTGTAEASQYWDQTTTQTITWQKTLRPYNSGTIAIDFNFTGSTITSGNVSWGYQAICTGPTHSISIDNIWTNYSVSASTGGPVPAMAGNPTSLTLTSQALSSCVQGDTLNFLVTRNHNVTSDALGDVRLSGVVLHEN